MDFKYIRRLKPFIILSMILIFMPIVTKAGGLVPTDFNGFAVTNEGVVVVGDNTAITGFKDRTEVFSFSLPLKTDYALSVNQDDNIVIYTKNARFVFAQDGAPLTLLENSNENYEELKNRKVVTTSNGASYVLTNKLGFINSIIKVENGEQTTAYRTPAPVLFAEFAFWEGNLILVVCFVAGLFDVRKRRFLAKPTDSYENNGLTETPEDLQPVKEKTELPKFLKAFQKPKIQNKGAAFSSEYSTKPGERPRFSQSAEKDVTIATNIAPETENETTENKTNETTEAQ
jgi:hypothetical protein